MPASEMTAMSVVPPSDIDDHVAARLGDGQPGADGRGHGLVDKVDLGGLGLERGVLDRALLHLGDLRGDPDDDARDAPVSTVVGSVDEVESIFSVISKSAMTPSFIGRMAAMLPGVRPSISLASRCPPPPPSPSCG